MPSTHSKVVTLRPRAWSATAQADAGLRGPTAVADPATLVGRLALSRGPLGSAVGDPVNLEQDAARFRDLFERAPVGMLVMDLQGRIRRANAMAAALLGQGPMGLCGRDLVSLCAPASIPPLCRHLRLLASGECFDACELELVAAGEETLAVHLSTLNVGDGCSEGPLRAALLDGSGVRELEEGLTLAASVVEHTAQGIIVTDAEYRTVAVNPAFTHITGLRGDEILGEVPEVFHPSWDRQDADPSLAERLRRLGHWQGEVLSRRRSGEPYTQWVIVNAIQDHQGMVTHYVCMVSDMTSHEEARRELRELAYNDSLTGLANRVSLMEQLSRTLVSARREKRLVGVLYLDLDHFKDVNDTLGHGIGDRLLRFVAGQLRGSVRATDLVARLGGDEFTVLVPDLKREQAAGQIATNILRRLAEEPFRDGDRTIRIGASIGIALFPKDAIDSEGLLACADAAMYEAKRAGRNGFRFHSAAVWTRYREGHALEHGLRGALERRELTVLYQPQVALPGFQILGCEALLEWRGPGAQPVDPSIFLRLAERTELIVPFQQWGLRQAAGQAVEWRARRGDLRVSMDISPVQLRDTHQPGLLDLLLELARARGGALELELRESALLDAPDPVLEACGRIHRLGVPLALDHCGSDPSPLTPLRRLPLTRLKLAGSLITDLGHDPGAAAVVAALIALGHGLGLRVLAQGVETPIQLQRLCELGCDEAQGDLFSPPLSAPLFAELLERATLTEPAAGHWGIPSEVPTRGGQGFLGAISGVLSRRRVRIKGVTNPRRQT